MKRKVAIYARVSTEHEAQLSALSNQIQYYDSMLEVHPEWELVERYIDEGITGTSIKKRRNFLRMMEDALQGKFDLIVTREVSRFARNTVDTLQQTRLLKQHGVEVYFSEDNIWTMNDEDGELKLTIMATLAQNESKKTSMRVKAGQAVSFENGVIYGNGNILGYDRVNNTVVVNQEQAKTVRMIYDLYLEGKGLRKIQYELEQRGRLTSTGKRVWDVSNISRILKNSFYCGNIVYRKQYVPDYLEQKKINNYGAVARTETKGNYEAIISEEQFLLVQEILNNKSSSIRAKERRGKKPCLDVYCRKMKCNCGASFNRKVWHRTKENRVQYAYQCYHQINTGTIATRTKKGLSVEGICGVPMVPGWKIRMMADWIFRTLWADKEKILEIANAMLEKYMFDNENANNSLEIQSMLQDIEKEKKRLETLVEMRLDGEISKNIFLEKKAKVEEKIVWLETEVAKQELQIEPNDGKIEDRIKALQNVLENELDFSRQEIPEEIIETFVDSINVYEDHFEWNLKLTNQKIHCKVDGTKRKSEVSLVESPLFVGCSTGCFE